jgi:hypothetical protein
LLIRGDILEAKLIFVTGYAKLPQGITAAELYSVIAIGLVVNIENGQIAEADCSLVTETGRRFVKQIIEGRNINDLDDIVEEIRSKYFGNAKKAIISALKMCFEKYQAAIAEDYNIDS